MKKLTNYEWDRYTNRSTEFLLLLIIFFFVTICKPATNTNHTDYLNKEFDVIEKIERAEGRKRAMIYFDSIFNLIPNPSMGDLYLKYDYNRNSCFQQKNYPCALSYVDSMLAIKEKVDFVAPYQSSYDVAYLFKGDILLELGKYNEAYNSFFEGKNRAEHSKNTSTLSEYSSRLGMVCYRQMKYIEAASYFKQAIAEQKDTKNWYYFTRIQELLDNTGMAYMGAGKPDSALFYYRKTLSFIAKNQRILPDNPAYAASAKGVVYGNLGNLYYESKNYKAAEGFFLTGIRLNTINGQESGIAQMLQAKLAELYLKNGRYEATSKLLADLRQSLNNSPNLAIEMDWNNLQSRLLEHIGKKDQALNYFRTFITLRDTIDRKSNLFKQVDIENEINRLTTTNRLLQLEAEDNQKRNFIYFGSSLIFLLLLFLYSTWKNYQKTKKNVLVLVDLNQKVNTKQAEMMVAYQSLEKSHEEHRHLIKVVAHDLKNPLVSSLNYLQFMEDDTALDSEQQRVVAMLKTIGSDSLVIIDELLQDNGSLPTAQVEKVDLHSVLQHCVNLLTLKAQEKSQDIELIGEPVSVLIDAEKIWRVMSNLIINAIKFSPIGGKITVRMQRKNDKVLTLIQDNGIGIPASYQATLFMMFTPSQRPGTAGEESFGIGLAVSKSIVESHQGKIWYESVEGQGTTFFVELPILS